MAYQNRVHPTGSLHAVDVRGDMMGNRGGRFHRPGSGLLSDGQPWTSRRWILCVLDFKGRQRTVWGHGYTELFFLDEATGLAAGHRPCFECRRADARLFQLAMHRAMKGNHRWNVPPKAHQMDTVLHAARIQAVRKMHRMEDLPVGTFFYRDGDVAAVTPTGTRLWSFDGYGPVVSVDPSALVQLITPAPVFHVLLAGYEPSWHSSALVDP